MSSKRIRRFFVLAMTAFVGAGVGGATAAVDRGTRANAIDVRVTVFAAATPSLGVYIADALGFFAKNNINLSYANVGTGSAAIQALVSGSTDFTISDVTGVTLARRNTGVDVRFVAGQFNRFMGALQCRSGSGITGSYPAVMQRLVGKKVGITAPGSSTDTYLRYSLIQAGVDPSRVSIIGIGGVPNLVAAIQAGSVDCITSYQPVQQILKGKVDTILNWAAGDGPKIFAANYPYNGLITTNKYAVQHPQAVRSFANAMRQAAAYGSNPANASTIAQSVAKFFPGIDTNTLEGLVADMATTFGYKMGRGAVGNAARVFNAINPSQKINYPYDSYIAGSMMDLTGPRVKIASSRKGTKVTLTWRGVDKAGALDLTDVASGVKSYDLHVKSGLSWQSRISGKSVNAYTVTLRKGVNLTVRVRARDRAGNVGPWAQTRV